MSDQDRFLLYTAPDGAVRITVFFKDETVWLTQKALAELFGVKVPAVNKHLKNIFDSGELAEESVVFQVLVDGGHLDTEQLRQRLLRQPDRLVLEKHGDLHRPIGRRVKKESVLIPHASSPAKAFWRMDWRRRVAR